MSAMAPPLNPHSAPDTQIGDLPLPLDALLEILLRLLAKDLCRFRAVCRSWRSLLSGPDFIAAHAARHPQPLIVAGYATSRYHGKDIICGMMDLSGHVIKRVRTTQDQDGKWKKEWVMSIQLDRICTGRGLRTSYQLLDPATGALCALPKGRASPGQRIKGYHTFLAFGKVDSTGEYKVLRVLDNLSHDYPVQLFDVCTHNGSSSSRWRGKESPPDAVKLRCWKSVVIGGIVYFLTHVPHCIASFDLDTEDWRQTLQGPPSGPMDDIFDCLALATLSGCLVVVHHTDTCYMDLWFLMDFKKGLWVKQHSIPIGFACLKYTVTPLLKLDDGRIVLVYSGKKSLIRTYNPRTNTFTNVAEVGSFVAVGLYTGSLLSLPTVVS